MTTNPGLVPSGNYLHQCWLNIWEILWHSMRATSHGMLYISILETYLKIPVINLILLLHSPEANLLKLAQGLQILGGCFTNVSWALQNILSKFVFYRNRASYENFKLKLCMCHGFGHTYKVSAWNSHHKCVFWYCVFSWDYFGELPKH